MADDNTARNVGTINPAAPTLAHNYSIQINGPKTKSYALTRSKQTTASFPLGTNRRFLLDTNQLSRAPYFPASPVLRNGYPRSRLGPAAYAPFNRQLHCYKRGALVTTHRPLLMNHRRSNRQLHTLRVRHLSGSEHPHILAFRLAHSPR